MGWSVDYASSNPSVVVGISDWWGVENSGLSLDGGVTWQKFATMPSFALNSIGGSIAAASESNFLWAPSGNHAPAYTLDGGLTWNIISLPGKTEWSAFHYAYYLDRTTVTADRVQPNTFYLYDVATGVYRSTDGGVNWSKVFSGPVSAWSGWNAKIEAVPGKAGELFFTAGPQAGDPTVAAQGALHALNRRRGDMASSAQCARSALLRIRRSCYSGRSGDRLYRRLRQRRLWDLVFHR